MEKKFNALKINTLVLYNVLFLILNIQFLKGQTVDDQNRYRLAQSYEAIGNYEKAFEIYKDLFNRFPTQYQFYDGYYRMLFQLKKYDEALSLLKNRLNQYPDNFNLYAELAFLYDRLGKRDSVNISINNGLNRGLGNPNSYKLISMTLVQYRMFDEAINVLELAKKRFPSDVNFLIDLINIHSLLMNYDQAYIEMISLLKKEAQYVSFIKSKLSQIINNPDALKSAIKIFESNAKKKDPAFMRLLSWLYFQNKDYSKAFETSLNLDKTIQAGGYEIFEFGNLAFRENQFIEAIKAYEYIIKNYSEKKDLQAMCIIGLAHSYDKLFELELNNNELSWKSYHLPVDTNNIYLSSALKYYEIIYTQYTLPNLVAESIYRSAYIYKEYFRNYSKARILIEKLKKDYVLSEFYVKGLLLEGEIEKILGHFNEAENSFINVRINPRATEVEKNQAQFQIGEILLYRGLIDSAKSIFSNLKKSSTQDIANDAIEYLMLLQEIEQNPQYTKILFDLNRAIENKNYKEAIEICKTISFNDDFSIFVNKIRFTLAELYITQNDYSNALAQLIYIYNLKEKSIYSDYALYKIGQLYLYGLKNKAKALENFEKLLLEFPNSIFVNHVREIIKQNQLEKI